MGWSIAFFFQNPCGFLFVCLFVCFCKSLFSISKLILYLLVLWAWYNYYFVLLSIAFPDFVCERVCAYVLKIHISYSSESFTAFISSKCHTALFAPSHFYALASLGYPVLNSIFALLGWSIFLISVFGFRCPV